MARLNGKLRSVEGGIAHWCPGCEEMHKIPSRWSFDGNLEAPTFSPSIKITGKQTIKVDGKWTGEWVRDCAGKAIDLCCHYILTAGILNFCPDCTHGLAGRAVPLPDIPEGIE